MAAANDSRAARWPVLTAEESRYLWRRGDALCITERLIGNQQPPSPEIVGQLRDLIDRFADFNFENRPGVTVQSEPLTMLASSSELSTETRTPKSIRRLICHYETQKEDVMVDEYFEFTFSAVQDLTVPHTRWGLVAHAIGAFLDRCEKLETLRVETCDHTRLRHAIHKADSLQLTVIKNDCSNGFWNTASLELFSVLRREDQSRREHHNAVVIAHTNSIKRFSAPEWALATYLFMCHQHVHHDVEPQKGGARYILHDFADDESRKYMDAAFSLVVCNAQNPAPMIRRPITVDGDIYIPSGFSHHDVEVPDVKDQLPDMVWQMHEDRARDPTSSNPVEVKYNGRWDLIPIPTQHRSEPVSSVRKRRRIEYSSISPTNVTFAIHGRNAFIPYVSRFQRCPNADLVIGPSVYNVLRNNLVAFGSGLSMPCHSYNVEHELLMVHYRDLLRANNVTFCEDYGISFVVPLLVRVKGYIDVSEKMVAALRPHLPDVMLNVRILRDDRGNPTPTIRKLLSGCHIHTLRLNVTGMNEDDEFIMDENRAREQDRLNRGGILPDDDSLTWLTENLEDCENSNHSDLCQILSEAKKIDKLVIETSGLHQTPQMLALIESQIMRLLAAAFTGRACLRSLALEEINERVMDACLLYIYRYPETCSVVELTIAVRQTREPEDDNMGAIAAANIINNSAQMGTICRQLISLNFTSVPVFGGAHSNCQYLPAIINACQQLQHLRLNLEAFDIATLPAIQASAFEAAPHLRSFVLFLRADVMANGDSFTATMINRAEKAVCIQVEIQNNQTNLDPIMATMARCLRRRHLEYLYVHCHRHLPYKVERLRELYFTLQAPPNDVDFHFLATFTAQIEPDPVFTREFLRQHRAGFIRRPGITDVRHFGNEAFVARTIADIEASFEQGAGAVRPPLPIDAVRRLDSLHQFSQLVIDDEKSKATDITQRRNWSSPILTCTVKQPNNEAVHRQCEWVPFVSDRRVSLVLRPENPVIVGEARGNRVYMIESEIRYSNVAHNENQLNRLLWLIEITDLIRDSPHLTIERAVFDPEVQLAASLLRQQRVYWEVHGSGDMRELCTSTSGCNTFGQFFNETGFPLQGFPVPGHRPGDESQTFRLAVYTPEIVPGPRTWTIYGMFAAAAAPAQFPRALAAAASEPVDVSTNEVMEYHVDRHGMRLGNDNVSLPEGARNFDRSANCVSMSTTLHASIANMMIRGRQSREIVNTIQRNLQGTFVAVFLYTFVFAILQQSRANFCRLLLLLPPRRLRMPCLLHELEVDRNQAMMKTPLHHNVVARMQQQPRHLHGLALLVKNSTVQPTMLWLKKRRLISMRMTKPPQRIE